jgi:hypothetical protein
LWQDIEVTHFIDKQAKGSLCSLDIIGFDVADFDAVDYIFIAFSANLEQAIDQIEEKGRRYNEDVFVLN